MGFAFHMLCPWPPLPPVPPSALPTTKQAVGNTFTFTWRRKSFKHRMGPTALNLYLLSSQRPDMTGILHKLKISTRLLFHFGTLEITYPMSTILGKSVHIGVCSYCLKVYFLRRSFMWFTGYFVPVLGENVWEDYCKTLDICGIKIWRFNNNDIFKEISFRGHEYHVPGK